MNNINKKIYKILLTGGGTGGSVAPLLAVVEELKNQDVGRLERRPTSGDFEFFWLGTKFGPEREMVEKAGIKFKAISGGKWRRYFSLKNLVDIIKIKLGFFQALFIMLKSRPDLVMSAGSFISVPVIWAAWLLGVPVLIHQQDIIPGLANKLMAPFAKAITVTFEKSLADYGKKAVWIGNPTRKNFQFSLHKAGQAIFNFQLNANLPVVLIVGGGTGAEAINNLAFESLDEFTKFCQIIHITGKDKGVLNDNIANYKKYEFLDAEKMAGVLNAADLVVTRAGLGFLSELSYLGKPSIIIPMPDSHQEANAEFFKSKKAAIVVDQKYLTAESFTHMIKDLLSDEKLRGRLAVNMKNAMKQGASEEMVKIIKSLFK
ncbi:MAG: undecaprenyldiphospho-muramoylpentapeptide beta-N-acetylglucosaminyltransferase [Patescibacteria group bacterium]|jgi:UDP-N-acetylglucosamine--N-acetylmuramyl-(pentapeptide) pyrophosphoryl-undecaprenol N-acetylglucosamine transferase